MGNEEQPMVEDKVKIEISANIELPRLYAVFLKRLIERIKKNSNGNMIKKKDFNEICSWIFKLKKEDAKKIAKELEKIGLLKIRKRGIEITCFT